MSSKLLDLSIFKSALKFLSNLKTTNNKANIQILEPLTTIVTLAITSFKPVGTKIAITSNKIYIQPPNALQAPLRWTYGNNREEIHFLLKPIFRAIQIYKPWEDDDIKSIFKNAVNGLKLLKNSYNNDSSTLCHALDLYINIIDNSLKNNDINVDSYNNLESIKTNLNLSTNTKLNLEKLFIGVWNDDEIRLISNMLRLSETNELEKKSYISAIESILSTKEKLINKIIENANKIL